MFPDEHAERSEGKAMVRGRSAILPNLSPTSHRPALYAADLTLRRSFAILCEARSCALASALKSRSARW